MLLNLQGCTSKQEAGKLNVLLITVDTLRADHMGCYNYPLETSPFMDKMAGEGTLFTQCYAPVPITLPSHCSIMTGTYPLHHGVRDNARYQRLDESNRTLAEVLLERGFQTAAVVSAFVLDKRFGISQGFDFYDDTLDEPYGQMSPGVPPPQDSEARLLWERQRSRFQQRAEKTTLKALSWVAQRDPESPFFLWVHYFDPHDPYLPPESFRTLFPPQGKDPVSYCISGYDGEIRYTDEQIQKLLEGVDQEGILAQTLVVLTSDHGEGLGDHKEQGKPIIDHGNNLYIEALRVPLLFRCPYRVPKRKAIHSRVSLLDIAPTILSFLGFTAPEVIQGRDLWPLILGEGELADRDLFFETLLPEIRNMGSRQEGLQDDQWKFILHGGGHTELYNITRDPLERENLSKNGKMEEVIKNCKARITDWKKRVTNLKKLQNELPLEPESLRKLRILGYLSGPDPGKKEKGKTN